MMPDATDQLSLESGAAPTNCNQIILSTTLTLAAIALFLG
jgi:hypothetical protein